MRPRADAPVGARPRAGVLPWPQASLVLAAGALLAGSVDSAAASERMERPLRRMEQLVAVRALRVYEHSKRGSIDFSSPSASSERLGPDPYALVVLEEGLRVATLRAEDAVVLLDEAGLELDRSAAPPRPSAVVRVGERAVLVAGGRSPEGSAEPLWRYDVEADRLVRRPEADVPSSLTRVDALATAGSTLVLAEHLAGRVEVLEGGAPLATFDAPRPFRVAVSASQVAVVSALDHALVVHPRLGAALGPAQRLDLDAPLYAVDLVDSPGGGFAVAVGLEDHPLDRTGGSFGYIDSYAYVVRTGGAGLERCGEIDLSALGVVSPKVVRARAEGDGLVAEIWGAATGARVRLEWPLASCPLGEPSVTVGAGVLGASDAAPDGEGGFVVASPLLDALVHQRPDGTASLWPIAALSPHAHTRSASSRLGELLVFTTAIAPWQRSEGELSRFSCEACHLEGGTDGRVHATGRGEVRANTKPLFGIANNAPHFTRALDRDTTAMVFAEFRVASARSGASEWFELGDAPDDYLEGLPWADAVSTSAWGLRRAMIDFFFDFAHAPNEAVVGRRSFDPVERRGAELFAERCVGCHAARTVTDDPLTELAPSAWEGLVLSRSGPIVWAREGYERTGVLPYVHAEGARTTSLRRVSSRSPLFSNGSAESLSELLERVGYTDDAFFHDGAPEGAAGLDASEIDALLAFLELL